MDEGEEKRLLSKRLVHLDLKGAPPKIEYLLRVVPLFRQWGATGILFEYEDMFPYSGDLSCISRHHVYSTEDIKCLQELCRNEGMLFVPLLQSFGHMEYVLKHESFKHLRELSNNPMALCPTNGESLDLVKTIVEQYIEEHDGLEYIHIGGDEVFCIGACKRCAAFLADKSLSQLYLYHMSPLIQFIHDKWPHLKVMIWDDMFRGFSTDELASLSGTVVPMVWCYYDNVFDGIPDGTFKRFGDVFDEIWIASSYKGSSGPCCDTVPTQHHINNHLSWIAYLEQLDDAVKVKVTGIALTGWSRYDHFATLCELLPQSLPCLALCLEVVRQERFDADIQQTVAKKLGYEQADCDDVLGEAICGNYPGSEIGSYVKHLETAKKQLRLAQERIDGWMDAWHINVKREFNLCHLQYAHNIANSSLQIYTNVKSPLQECLLFHFDEETVKEFIVVKLDKKVKDLLDMLVRLKSIESPDRMKTS